MGVFMGVIVEISVGKPDGNKVECWLGRILGNVINKDIGNCEGFSMYQALGPILVCELGGWYMPTGNGT